MEEIYGVVFGVPWCPIIVSGTKRGSKTADFGGIGASWCIKLFTGSFVGGWI